MSAKRIAIIGNQAFSMLNFRGALIRQLAADGREVFAFAPDFDDSTRAAVRRLGGKPMDHYIERTSKNPLRDARATLDLIAKLRVVKPAVVLSYSIKPVIYGTVAAWLAGVPHRLAMIEGLGHVFMERASVSKGVMRLAVTVLYKLSLSRAERVIFLNFDDLEDFARLRLITRESAFVLGAIGVDLSQWKAVPPIIDPFSFLFVGRLLREKGIMELVEAMRRVRKTHPGAKLILLGDVDSNPSSVSRNTVSAWVAEGLLEWPGHVEVEPWIARASVFILPSYREGVPRSTQEAMAMGRAVITTDVPGCRETVVEGRNGFLVAARDSEALADAMRRFLDEPQLAYSMGQESRKIAEERFDVARSTAALAKLLDLSPQP